MNILIKNIGEIKPLVHDGTFTWLSNMCHCTKNSFEEKKKKKEKRNKYKYIYHHRNM